MLLNMEILLGKAQSMTVCGGLFTCVFEAHSTEGGTDFFVDRHVLALSLFKELTSQKAATKKSS
jgi:hypothetical protein